MGATTQHITYNEFLPRIIGLNAMNLYDLRVRTEGYSNDYDPTCNPSIFNEFATAAFRYGYGIALATISHSRNHMLQAATLLQPRLFIQVWPFIDQTHADENVR